MYKFCFVCRGHGRTGNEKPKNSVSREKVKRQESKKIHHRGQYKV